MTEVLELGNATGRFKVHFASAREVFNMVLAAIAGEKGDPGKYRDYYLLQILKEAPSQTVSAVAQRRNGSR